MALILKLMRLIINLTPRRLMIKVSEAAAAVYCAFNTKTKRMLAYNHSKLFGRTGLERKLLSNYFISFADFINSSNRGYIEKVFVSDINFERIENQLQKGKGLITLTPHFGFWEAGPLLFLLKNFSVNVIYQPYEKPEYAKFFDSIRNKDVKWLPVKNAAKDALNALKRNEILATAVDIDYSENGVYVPFLSGKIRLPLGPAVLSYHLGTPIMLCYARMLGNGMYKTEFEDIIYPNQSNEKIIEVQRICSEIALCLAGKIKQFPEQWFYFKKIEE